MVTQPNPANLDERGVERTRKDEPGMIDKYRDKWQWFDHIMRMQERYAAEGGNQFSAGITYYSVLSIFPLAMLLVATIAAVLANREDLLNDLQSYITDSIDGNLSESVNEILDTAIDQRGAMFGIGGLTTLWSGLGWMNHLRIGISAMWGIDANDGGSFLKKKFSDLLGLIGLIIAFVVAFGVTAAGSSGLTQKIFDLLGIDSFPGMGYVFFFSGLLLGLIANFIVMWWLIMILPRTKVPKKSGFIGAAIGAVAFEAIKQLSTVIMSSATGSPAGAVFGPVIVLMVVMYLIWRVVLYISAWTATTAESLKFAHPPVPEPAVIRVRNEVREGAPAGAVFGVGAALGAAAVGVAKLFRRK